MGGAPGSQEDMFAKLDSMREVITEVNTQFKDPVRNIYLLGGVSLNYVAGKNDFHMRLHFGVFIVV